MPAVSPGVTVAGADGCKAGWIAVIRRPGSAPEAAVFGRFEHLVDALDPNAIMVVDMPIGLPNRVGPDGRGPERLVRAKLGARQSSVFSIPSRAAVYAQAEPFTSVEAWYEAHRRASVVARATSEPPRAISIQAFGIFSRIRELDELLRARPGLCSRVIESHPEAAFWRLNGERAMETPKKIRGTVNPEGMNDRRALLASRGVDRAFLHAAVPRGAGADDFLDAVAMMMVAERHVLGLTAPFPDPPSLDSHGLQIAIWT